MIGATLDVGSNIVLIVTLIINAFTLAYSKRAAKELKPNGGQSVKDTATRTEETVHAIAEAAGIPHPTPPNGIPVTKLERN